MLIAWRINGILIYEIDAIENLMVYLITDKGHPVIIVARNFTNDRKAVLQ